MDSAWFHAALERAGLSQADLARRLRLAPSAVSRMMSGERQMKLLEAAQIANLLGVPSEAVLRHGGARPESDSQGATEGPRRRGRPAGRVGLRAPAPAFEPAPRESGRDLIAIRSAARGGAEQEMFLEDGPIGYTPRPANLGGVRGAYAIYMIGDSMEPRYEPGWLLHVNPFKPPVRGRDVVVYKTNRAVLIKQFVCWEKEMLVLRQLNPDETLRIPRAEIAECHLVVGADQEG